MRHQPRARHLRGGRLGRNSDRHAITVIRYDSTSARPATRRAGGFWRGQGDVPPGSSIKNRNAPPLGLYCVHVGHGDTMRQFWHQRNIFGTWLASLNEKFQNWSARSLTPWAARCQGSNYGNFGPRGPSPRRTGAAAQVSTLPSAAAQDLSNEHVPPPHWRVAVHL